MEPDKNPSPEDKKSGLIMTEEPETPAQELQALKASNKRKNVLLAAVAIFVIALACVLWWFLARQG
jgi:hypothetical protein